MQKPLTASAQAQVACQFCYTTLFGWYATWLLLRSGHLVSLALEVVDTSALLLGACTHVGILTSSSDGLQAAPVAAHAFCNVLGFPDFGSIAEHPRPRAVALAFAAGIGAFAAGLLPLTRPAMFSNASRDSGNAYIDACRQLVQGGR